MQRTFGIHRLWVITVAVVSVQQLRVMKKMHWFRSKWQKKKTRKIQYLLYTFNKNCNLKEFSEISGTQTDQLQAVPVSVGGGVMDRTVTLFVSERKGRSALQQKLQTSATQTRRDRCQMLVKPCVTTNIGEVVQQLKMQLGREKPQNLQMPLERPVQNYTPLARWNVQLILKTLGPGRIRLSGPNSNNLSSEIRRFWCDFFSLSCVRLICVGLTAPPPFPFRPGLLQALAPEQHDACKRWGEKVGDSGRHNREVKDEL